MSRSGDFKQMSILSLDLGTKTGWALQTQSGIDSGSISFATKRNEGGGMRYLKFKRWLTETKQKGVSEVYYEEVRNHAGITAAHVYGAFEGHLIAWCEHHKIPYQSVPVGTIKKFATGRGNADKQAMIHAAQKFGFNPVDDNEADAIHLLRLMMAENAIA